MVRFNISIFCQLNLIKELLIFITVQTPLNYFVNIRLDISFIKDEFSLQKRTIQFDWLILNVIDNPKTIVAVYPPGRVSTASPMNWPFFQILTFSIAKLIS